MNQHGSFIFTSGLYGYQSEAYIIDGLVGCPSSRLYLLHIGSYKICGSGGIRTHASEETGALNQRLRPLGHATKLQTAC